MFFSRKDKKSELQGHKTLVMKGQRIVIRKLNPLLDFSPERMPQIFSALQPRRKVPAAPPEMDEKKVMAEMMATVEAAVVTVGGLPLVEVGKGERRGKEDGITVEDLFRDQEFGAKLYWEIITHSLDRQSGLGKIFFYLLTKRLSFMF